MIAFLLPVGMAILSFVSVLSGFGLDVMTVGLWVLGLSATSFIGYKLFPIKGIRYHSERNAFTIPGSWLSFAIIMAIFFTKYAVAVMKASNAALLNDAIFISLLCLTYGFFSGFFMSRMIGLAVAKANKV